MSRIGSEEGFMIASPARLLGRYGSVLWRYGHPDGKGAAFRAGIVPSLNLAAVGTHNPVTNAQAEPRAFAGLFGGVEGIKNALHVGYAGSIVADGHLDIALATPRLQVNFAAAPRLFCGVIGVVQQVKKDLLQLLGVAHDCRQVFVVVFDDFNAVTDEIVAAQLGGLPQDGIDVRKL